MLGLSKGLEGDEGDEGERQGEVEMGDVAKFVAVEEAEGV